MADIFNALLYRPNMEHYCSSVIACFCISDGWNEQTLLKLKERTCAYLLVGIQITDSNFECFDIVDGVVRCQPEDIQQVVKLLDISPRSLIGIDVMDIKSLFKLTKTYKFIQTYTSEEFGSNRKKNAVHELISQLPENPNIKGMLVGMESSDSISLDNTTYIIEALENCVIADDLDKYYCTSIANDTDSFYLRMIYAENY